MKKKVKKDYKNAVNILKKNKTQLSMLRLLPSFGEFSSGKFHCLQPPALRRDSSEHCTKSL